MIKLNYSKDFPNIICFSLLSRIGKQIIYCKIFNKQLFTSPKKIRKIKLTEKIPEIQERIQNGLFSDGFVYLNFKYVA